MRVFLFSMWKLTPSLVRAEGMDYADRDACEATEKWRGFWIGLCGSLASRSRRGCWLLSGGWR